MLPGGGAGVTPVYLEFVFVFVFAVAFVFVWPRGVPPEYLEQDGVTQVNTFLIHLLLVEQKRTKLIQKEKMFVGFGNSQKQSLQTSFPDYFLIFRSCLFHSKIRRLQNLPVGAYSNLPL